MVKRLAIAVSAVFVIFLGLCYVAWTGLPSVEHLGGGWTLKTRQYLIGSHRSSASRLYYSSNDRVDLVDQFVAAEHYYGEDCLAYVTLRTGSSQYFAVCSDRIPVLLATETSEEWTLSSQGMQKMSWVEEGDKLIMKPTTFLSAGVIRSRARQQPRRSRGR